ncbi:MAG: hemolysin family protein [Acidobacteriia bacterium]|nr:hemolysin family protein [Terriglobia bacterium]
MVTLEVSLLVVLFALAVFAACSETALFAVNRYYIKGLAAKGNYRAKLVLAVIRRPERILATILFMSTLANVAMAAVTSTLVADLILDPHRDLVLASATILLTIVLLIFAEITPKTIAARHADRLALALIQPLRVMMALAQPVVVVGSGVANLIARHLDTEERKAPNLSDVALHSIIDESGVDSASTDRQKMLRGVLSLSDLAVKSVTIPRPEVTALSVDATAEEVFQTIRASGYSRIPVYRKNLDNIVGILHAKDVLPGLFERIQDLNRSRAPMELVHVMRKPLFVPDTAKVDVTLKYMQRNHIHLAVVIDEHGGMEGIVTLEDLLEQIVGEIQDEHDFELDAIRHLSDESMLVDGDISIREMNKRLKLRLPESSHYSTLAGFLLAQSGRILVKGEEVVFDQWKFLVVETEGRRLVKVRMERYLAEPEPVTVSPSRTR